MGVLSVIMVMKGQKGGKLLNIELDDSQSTPWTWSEALRDS